MRSACRLYAIPVSELVREQMKVHILVDKMGLDYLTGFPCDGSIAHTVPFDSANKVSTADFLYLVAGSLCLNVC